MTGIQGISAYQQTSQAWKTGQSKGAEAVPEKEAAGRSAAGSKAKSPEIEKKSWSPIASGSSLIPQKTEYGFTIGNVALSEKAADYYEKLKSKYHGMEFIAVSKDMKEQVKKNAASYGNANKMVVLIDEEKIERMAEDENFRKKYEGIIAMSQAKLTEAKNSLSSSGAAVKNFGMSVDENGNEKFFATVEKSLDSQKERIRAKAEEKKAEKKKAEKKAEEKKAEKKATEKKAEKKASEESSENAVNENEEIEEQKEYITFESGSLDNLISKVRTYSEENAIANVRTEAELSVGGHIDFRG